MRAGHRAPLLLAAPGLQPETGHPTDRRGPELRRNRNRENAPSFDRHEHIEMSVVPAPDLGRVRMDLGQVDPDPDESGGQCPRRNAARQQAGDRNIQCRTG